MNIVYRWGQFWRTWHAPPLPEIAYHEIKEVLSEQEAELFGRFSLSDQQHSYQVLRTLESAGQTHADLLVAALLHDIGKTRVALSIWDRSLIVLAQRLLPGKTTAWGKGEAHGWRRPFVVKAQHPVWGAEMARAAGSRPLTITLIRRHQDKLPETIDSEEDELLRWLQLADNQN